MRDRETENVIETEIQRLKAQYRSSQDRYAFTGSSSCDKTMTKCRILIDALERSLVPSEKSILSSRLDRIRKTVDVQREKGQMSAEAYDAIVRSIHEGRDE